ncbi:retrovirus-related pol polyprotein from transposon TNT 1-94 [Tanacetum coccineum]
MSRPCNVHGTIEPPVVLRLFMARISNVCISASTDSALFQYDNPKLRTKLYSVTPFPKSKVIPKVVEKNDVSKSATSHLTTNKIIENCTKVLAPSLLKIETEPINAYFKNNRIMHRDYLRVTKEHVATLQELLDQARAMKPLDEHIRYAFKKTVPPSNDTSAIVVLPGHILTTTVIPVNVPCPKLRLGHNLISVGQFCYSDLEVAFRKHTCFVQDLEGVDLLSGSRGSSLYTISMVDMMKSSAIFLLSKASKTKSWLWHRRLSHLNFGTINQLAKQGLVKGLPKLKYNKDHFCLVCQMGKSKKESLPHKLEPSTNEKLQMLHMDLCGPIRVESINKKRYILVIVDDYSCFTWVKFLRTKDEAPDIIIKFLKQAQFSLNAIDLGNFSHKEDIGISSAIHHSKKGVPGSTHKKGQTANALTMNVQFDEITQMASEQHGLGLDLHGLTFGHISSGLVLN